MVETTTRAPAADAACCPPRAPARERWPFVTEDARLVKALADETRLGIVLQLREQGEVCQCDFVACCTVGQPTVSHHLRILREAGVVAAEKRGVWMHYRLNRPALERLQRYLG
jgi:ArsR family transcriptional regulator, arsenate/arsenite/antimonite-responsive transcriptional repressor